jgi:putative RNA 2'-phosphotransferase
VLAPGLAPRVAPSLRSRNDVPVFTLAVTARERTDGACYVAHDPASAFEPTRMDPDTLTGLSKFLSFVLRHRPESIELDLDPGGWADIDELIEKCCAHGKQLSRDQLETIVATSPKRRFAISPDGRRVRASQGHSIEVDLGHAPAAPPELLFHGTVRSSLDAIRADGLRRMERHHVHLSPDQDTARTVGMRRGKPVVLVIAAGRMHRDGHVFYLSDNGVWLVDEVPPGYIELPAP